VVSGGEVVYAGFWKRYAAYFLDSFLVGIINFPVSLVFNGIGAVSDNSAVMGVMYLLGILAGFVIGIAYYAWFHSSRGGATLGKMAVGIKVVRSDGERLTFMRAFGRYWGFILSSLTLFIGFIMAAFTERKQALHDMLCDTVVVDKWAFTEHAEFQERGLGTVTVIILVLNGILLLGVLALAVFAGIAASSMS